VGKVIQFPESMKRHNRLWNEGYSDGYNKQVPKVDMPDPYYTGYDVGKDDREEDEEAIASGDFDDLSEAERLHLYGEERDRI
jgi:hypothetical protein